MKKIAIYLPLFFIAAGISAQEIQVDKLFFKAGIMTRFEYAHVYGLKKTFYDQTKTASFLPGEDFARNVTLVDFMVGPSPRIYFYAQVRFSSGLPHNIGTQYFGRGLAGGGLLLGLGGEVLETAVGTVYVNWGLIWDSPWYDTFDYIVYFDNEINAQFHAEINNRVAFLLTAYFGFGATRYRDMGGEGIAFIKFGAGIGFSF